MSSLLKMLNGAVTWLFDVMFLPVRGMGPLWALLIFSVLTGVLMLWIFGKVSDQDTIKVVRDRVRGHLLGIRLFGDDVGTLFLLQWRLLRDNAIYMKFALLPMLIMLVPVLLILAQLNLRFEMQPLEPGQIALVKVQVRDAQTIRDGVTLEVPDGIVVETPAVRAPSILEVAWRVRAENPGSHVMRIHADNAPVEKTLVIADHWGATSSLRTSGVIDGFLYPGEAPIDPASGIVSIEVTYPGLPLRIFGFELHWMVIFFVVSLVAGFALRGPLGVEI
jgi:uncharacterized membrane protein (DUF106 family)